MLTPQEVSSHAFPKAVVGGYNMSSVDEFLDELTDDYTALYKENAALKAKLKVLVEKVEDYRSTEDSMRATLLTAQKMADSIVHEAEGKRDQILSQAESDARVKIGELQGELTAAQDRLHVGRQELAEFIAAARGVCQRELQFLEQLPDMPANAAPAADTAAPAPETPRQASVSEIEQSILARFGTAETAQAEAKPAEEPAAPVTPAAPAAPAEPAPQAPAADSPLPQDYPEGNPFEGARTEARDDDPTRRINLKDLKFGRNYSGANDEDDD